MSFIKDSGENDKMATSDIILVLVIVLGGLGLWWYTSSSKSRSFEAFDAAQKLVDEKKYEEAFDAWFELQSISYKSDSLDSLLYENLSFLEELKDGNVKSYFAIDKMLKESPVNQVKIQQRLKVIKEPYFLKPEQLDHVTEWRKRFGVSEIVDSSQVDSSDVTANTQPATPAE